MRISSAIANYIPTSLTVPIEKLHSFFVSMQYHAMMTILQCQCTRDLDPLRRKRPERGQLGRSKDISQYLGPCDGSCSVKLSATWRSASIMGIAYKSRSGELTAADCACESCFLISFHNEFLRRFMCFFHLFFL